MEKFRMQLQSANLKVTQVRLAMLDVMSRQARPLAVSEVLGKLKIEADQATVYRNLNSLVERGVLKRVQIKPKISHYELASLPHHHHLRCEDCGKLEDLELECRDLDLSKTGFKQVTNHNLEYAGICEVCAT